MSSDGSKKMTDRARARLNLWHKKFRPRAGALTPGDTKVVTFSPGIQPEEEAIVLTPHPGDVRLRVISAEEVEVINETDRVVPYFFAVTPRKYIALTTVKWAQVAAQTKRALKHITIGDALEFFMRLLSRGVENASQTAMKRTTPPRRE